MTNICVIGTGYVGFTASVCFANLGNDCIGVDINSDRVKSLNGGIPPIYETGLRELLEINLREKRLYYTTELKEAVKESEVIFICVGTPENSDGSVDLSQVYSVAESIGKAMNKYKVIVNKSTVPIGTAEAVKNIIKKNYSGEFDVVSNPEFLREGAAMKDFFNPDRIIIGTESEKAAEIMKHLYKAVERVENPIIVTDTKSAELIKYASNAYLATKISFINEIARYAEVVGADVTKVAKGMGLDKRIGSRFLHAGIGYGGSCFPKDVKGILYSAKSAGVELQIIKAVDKVNHEQPEFVLKKILLALKTTKGKKVAVLGLAFKPKTDDVRNAPAETIIKKLIEAGVKISAFDPVAEDNFKKIFPQIEYFSNPYDTAKGADLLFISTEWDQFRDIDKKRLKSLMKQPIIVDGRNIYEPNEMKKAGFEYISVGRK
ncbi:MAG: UDP-glucose/GDP-mannose dehydrogenase family protein [Candidatus Diapherotrites archaeon]|nr:UDP-glucose/GDP-mannose dehydrogenase family protein [Candidatus Diapherotrites archaeon]